MAEHRRPGFTGDQRKALMGWWQGLNDRRGERAELRRCRELDEVLKTNAFQHFHTQMKSSGLRGKRRLGAVAGLLAHIREHNPSTKSFAAQMADGEGGRPPVSELRFRRLLSVRQREKLYHPLLRVLHILGTPPQTNVLAVAHDMYFWDECVRRGWARDYYEAVFKTEAKPLPEAQSREDVWQAWWEDLQRDERRGERAALQRCHSLHEVQLTPGYHRLRHHMRKALGKSFSDYRLAAVAGLVAHVEKNDERTYFAVQMAWSKKLAEASEEERKKLKNDNARLRGLRFRRLLQITEYDNLYHRLIRVLRLLSGTANVRDLAKSVYRWGDAELGNKERRRWALDYYTHAPADET